MNRAGSVWITEQEIQRLAQAGLWYRVDFRYDFSHAERDTFAWFARLHGLKFLPILIWNAPRPETFIQWTGWRTYVQDIVRRYPWQTWWQIWNEPNNSRVPNTYFGDNLDAWRGFTRRTARYIKEANPNAMVVAGGIAIGGHGSKQITTDWVKWGPWFHVNEIIDRVAIHTYCGVPEEAARAINAARRVSDQPVWITELGRKSTVDGEATQDAWYRRVRGLTEGPLFWFCLQDVDGGFDGFGAFRRNWTAKPVWSSLT